MGMKSMIESVKRRKWLWIATATIVLTLSLVVYFRYYFVYSEGTRVGILYKFSKKGTFFKTYEGEMVLPGIKFKQSASGLSSNMFHFSVSDEELANKLMESQGMELKVHYQQYNNALPWRGDDYDNENGQYVVDELVKIKDENPDGYVL